MKTLIAVMILIFGVSDYASAKTHCFCKVTTDDSNKQKSPKGTVLKDYPIPVEWRTSIGHDKECRNLCLTASNADINSSQIATAACNAKVADGVILKAYAAVGTDKYESVSDIGKIKRSSPQSGCASNQGELYNGKCVKKAPANCPPGWTAKAIGSQAFCVIETDPVTISSGTCGF